MDIDGIGEAAVIGVDDERWGEDGFTALGNASGAYEKAVTYTETRK